MHLTLTVSALLAAISPALADCKCGWNFKSQNHPASTEVFAEYQETTFADDLGHVTWNVIGSAPWIAQSYEMSPSEAGGPYGKAARLSNVRVQYDHGDTAGLQLWVRHDPVKNAKGQLIGMGEVVSGRKDILYGSFFVNMKTTAVNGTTAAFTLYHGDNSDIDLYVNSRTQDPISGRNLIGMMNHSPTGVASSKEYGVIFAPSQLFIEYRIDWLPGRIDFYANGTMMGSFNDNVPDQPARMHLLHWSNGNPESSGGPPAEDAVMTVQYVKAFFNSTDRIWQDTSRAACSGGSATCEVQGGPPHWATKSTTQTTTAGVANPTATPSTIANTKESQATRNNIPWYFIWLEPLLVVCTLFSLSITILCGGRVMASVMAFNTYNLAFVIFAEHLRGWP